MTTSLGQHIETSRRRTVPWPVRPPPTALPELLGFETAWFDLPGLRMHAAAAGPSDGPLVVLLHGFPEFWYSWRHQIGPLARAGFRVLAPDQRGYNLTGKDGPYDLATLAGDVVHLLDAAAPFFPPTTGVQRSAGRSRRSTASASSGSPFSTSLTPR
jgi:alpha-beta hydrolase superfamily lysophospholipase